MTMANTYCTEPGFHIVWPTVSCIYGKKKSFECKLICRQYVANVFVWDYVDR